MLQGLNGYYDIVLWCSAILDLQSLSENKKRILSLKIDAKGRRLIWTMDLL